MQSFAREASAQSMMSEPTKRKSIESILETQRKNVASIYGKTEGKKTEPINLLGIGLLPASGEQIGPKNEGDKSASTQMKNKKSLVEPQRGGARSLPQDGHLSETNKRVSNEKRESRRSDQLREGGENKEKKKTTRLSACEDRADEIKRNSFREPNVSWKAGESEKRQGGGTSRRGTRRLVGEHHGVKTKA